MLDSGYESGQSDPNWSDVVRPTRLPSFPGELAPDGKVVFGMRQTRFGLKTSTLTRYGDLKTRFEFELFGTEIDAGQTTFRLRHAYGELGQFGAVQTRTLFVDPGLFPKEVEYWGPSGIAWFRNVQVRWMPIRNERMRLTFAAEGPGASADQRIYAQRIELRNLKPKFFTPDFSWQFREIGDWGYVQLAGLFQKISRVDNSPNPMFHLGGDSLGWGLNLRSDVNLTKTDIGRFDFIYGSGIENYMNDAPADIAIKNKAANPVRPIVGVALPVLGATVFLHHSWSDYFTSAAGYSLIDIQNSTAQAANAFHQGHSALGNLLYYPVTNIMIGGEFQYGRRVDFHDGSNVNLSSASFVQVRLEKTVRIVRRQMCHNIKAAQFLHFEGDPKIKEKHLCRGQKILA
jgi:hypothetical protein